MAWARPWAGRWRSGAPAANPAGTPAALYPSRSGAVLGAAGAGGFRPAAVPGAGPVVLWADGDKTGALAALRLGAALRARGRDVRVRTLRRVKGERSTMAKDDGKRARALAALRKHAPALKRLSADPADLADLGFTEADRAALADLGAALADLPDADLGAVLADLPDADLGAALADLPDADLADLGAALADLPDADLADLGAALADLPDLGGDHGDP